MGDTQASPSISLGSSVVMYTRTITYWLHRSWLMLLIQTFLSVWPDSLQLLWQYCNNTKVIQTHNTIETIIPNSIIGQSVSTSDKNITIAKNIMIIISHFLRWSCSLRYSSVLLLTPSECVAVLLAVPNNSSLCLIATILFYEEIIPDEVGSHDPVAYKPQYD